MCDFIWSSLFSSNALLFDEFPNRLFRGNEDFSLKDGYQFLTTAKRKAKNTRLLSIAVSQAKQQMTRFIEKRSSRRLKFCQFNCAPADQAIASDLVHLLEHNISALPHHHLL